MTILSAIEAVRTNMAAAIPTFIYCDLNEANIEADFKAVTDYPLMILLPFAPVDIPGKSGKLKTTANLTFFLLGKHEQATSEHKASEVETAVVAPMRLLARRFVHKLGEHSIIDPESNGIQSVTYNPTYMQLDANLHGVEVVFTIPVMENAVVCVP
jgi:hypothetical protein